MSRLFCAALLLALASTGARAQGDAPRNYQLAPVGGNVLSFTAMFDRSRQFADPGQAIQGNDIKASIGVLQYTRTFAAAGRFAMAFGALQFGEVKGTVSLPAGNLSGGSSGLSDAQIGGVLGLIGSPALSDEAYAGYQPGFSLGALGKVFIPTGEYDGSKVLNLGANRWALQAGATMNWTFGKSYLDRSLATLELLPSVTFFTANNQPNGGDRSEQRALFRLEGHATRNVSRELWLSADALYTSGGETTTDGVRGGNVQRSLMMGLTAGLTLSQAASLTLSYGGVVRHNDSGRDGQIFRVIANLSF